MNDATWTVEDDRRLLRLQQAVEARDLAGALLAIEGAPEHAVLQCQYQLDHWAEKVRRRLSGDDPASHLEALSNVLVREQGLRGDARIWESPPASYLSQVVRRRTGLPILLTSVWTLVGERAGIPVDGIALPFHFIARVGGPEGALVDPWDGGKPLSIENCAEIVHNRSGGEVVFTPELIRVADLTGTLERVLRNLLDTFHHSADGAAIYRNLRQLACLHPHDPTYVMAHARVADSLNEIPIASQAYLEVMARFPGTPEEEEAGRRLSELVSRVHLVN